MTVYTYPYNDFNLAQSFLLKNGYNWYVGLFKNEKFNLNIYSYTMGNFVIILSKNKTLYFGVILYDTKKFEYFDNIKGKHRHFYLKSYTQVIDINKKYIRKLKIKSLI